MTKASDNAFPSILITEGTEPSAPAAGKQRLYIDSTSHKLKRTDSSAVDVTIEGGVSSGTSNPGSPSDGDLFYRTDIDLLIRYRSTGTRWVTTDLYREQLGTTAAGVSADGNIGRMSPWHTTYDLWLETFYATAFVATTNDGTKYWTLALQKANAADAKTGIVSVNTSAATVNNWTTFTSTIGAALTPATYKELDVQATKTSTPGTLYFSVHLAYRLIVT